LDAPCHSLLKFQALVKLPKPQVPVRIYTITYKKRQAKNYNIRGFEPQTGKTLLVFNLHFLPFIR
jgi:hypothetical protein